MPAPSSGWRWRSPARATRRRSRRRSARWSIPSGTVVHAGKEEFAKALQLIKDGKPIKYEGVIGPITFDEFGDITGPFRLWRIKDGEITTVGTMSTADVNAVKEKIGNQTPSPQ